MKKGTLFILAVFMLGLVFINLSFTTSAKQQITLRMMGWEPSPMESVAVEDGLKKFMEENPHIKVEWTPVPGDYSSKLLTMMAGKAAPDVFYCECASYEDFARRGVLLNLTDYVRKSDFDLQDWIPMSVEKMLVDGEIYGICSCLTAAVMFYNKDLFDAAGVEYPPAKAEKAWTWDEFVETAKKLTKTKDGRVVQYGVYGFETTWGWVFPSMVFSNRGEVMNADYTELLLDSPEAKEALVKMKELRTKHNVSPSASFLQNIGMNAAQMLQTGRVAMVVDGSWALQELGYMDFPVGIGVLPKMKDAVTIAQSHNFCAWAETPYPDEAWRLVKFLGSKYYQTLFIRYGIWMPNFKDMYTKESMMEWFNPNVHPEGYKEMLDYFKNARLWPGVKTPAKAWDIICEELDNYYQANQPLDKVIDRMKQRVDKELSK